jgi:hypothetical protein
MPQKGFKRPVAQKGYKRPQTKAKASRSLSLPNFVDKQGNDVPFYNSTNDSEPQETFIMNPPGRTIMVGEEQGITLMCPKRTEKDAKDAGVDMNDFEEFLQWVRRKKGPVTKVFKATADEKNNRAIWILEKDNKIDPKDYTCLPYSGIVPTVLRVLP